MLHADAPTQTTPALQHHHCPAVHIPASALYEHPPRCSDKPDFPDADHRHILGHIPPLVAKGFSSTNSSLGARRFSEPPTKRDTAAEGARGSVVELRRYLRAWSSKSSKKQRGYTARLRRRSMHACWKRRGERFRSFVVESWSKGGAGRTEAEREARSSKFRASRRIAEFGQVALRHVTRDEALLSSESVPVPPATSHQSSVPSAPPFQSIRRSI